MRHENQLDQDANQRHGVDRVVQPGREPRVEQLGEDQVAVQVEEEPEDDAHHTPQEEDDGAEGKISELLQEGLLLPLHDAAAEEVVGEGDDEVQELHQHVPKSEELKRATEYVIDLFHELRWFKVKQIELDGVAIVKHHQEMKREHYYLRHCCFK